MVKLFYDNIIQLNNINLITSAKKFAIKVNKSDDLIVYWTAMHYTNNTIALFIFSENEIPSWLDKIVIMGEINRHLTLTTGNVSQTYCVVDVKAGQTLFNVVSDKLYDLYNTMM